MAAAAGREETVLGEAITAAPEVVPRAWAAMNNNNNNNNNNSNNNNGNSNE